MNGKLKFCTFSASISNIPWITSVCTCSVYMMTLLVIKAVFTWYATVHSKKPTITFYEYKKVNAYKRWFGGGGHEVFKKCSAAERDVKTSQGPIIKCIMSVFFLNFILSVFASFRYLCKYMLSLRITHLKPVV